MAKRVLGGLSKSNRSRGESPLACNLTIRSSRRHFVARLNSGVRLGRLPSTMVCGDVGCSPVGRCSADKALLRSFAGSPPGGHSVRTLPRRRWRLEGLELRERRRRQVLGPALRGFGGARLRSSQSSPPLVLVLPAVSRLARFTACCWAWLRRVTVVPNNSFKPTPLRGAA